MNDESVPEGAEFYHKFWVEYSDRLSKPAKVTAERQNHAFAEFHADLLSELFASAPGTRCANFGCGKGTHSLPMERRGFRVVNADFSSEALELTRQYYESEGVKPLLVRCDLAHLPFRDDAFDVIMNFGVMEHFHDIATPYAEMCRTLKRDGIFHSEIVTRRFSLLSVEIFISAVLYTLYNLVLFRFGKIRGLSRSAHMSEDFYENSYPLQHYEKTIARCGVAPVRSVGVRPFVLLQMPAWMDRMYARVLVRAVPLIRRVTLSGSSITKWICPVWLVYGRKSGSPGKG